MQGLGFGNLLEAESSGGLAPKESRRSLSFGEKLSQSMFRVPGFMFHPRSKPWAPSMDPSPRDPCIPHIYPEVSLESPKRQRAHIRGSYFYPQIVRFRTRLLGSALGFTGLRVPRLGFKAGGSVLRFGASGVRV